MNADKGAGPAGPMLADIRRQAAVIDGLWRQRREIQAFRDAYLQPDPGGRLFAFGSGDGWFAARAIVTPHNRLQARSSLDFLVHDAPTLGPADRVLGISMSGNVDRTLEAGEAVLERRAGMALLTNGDGGRVGALGVPSFNLDLPSIAPFLCGTATYTASVAVLALMFDEADLATASSALDRTIEATGKALAELDLAAVSGVRFLSVGAGLATADYGAAKLVEVTAQKAWTDDIEEFAHRQFWTASPEELIVFLSAMPEAAAYASASAEALAGMNFQTAAVETSAAPVPGAEARLALPAGPFPLLAAVPLQLLAFHLALAGGLDPNTRKHLKADDLRFRTSRLLTRRSLVGTGQ